MKKQDDELENNYLLVYGGRAIYICIWEEFLEYEERKNEGLD